MSDGHTDAQRASDAANTRDQRDQLYENKIAHLQAQLAECRKERDEALRLAEGLQRYVEYLHQADSKTAVYLATHGWKWPDDFIARGDKLRAEIAALAPAPAGGSDK